MQEWSLKKEFLATGVLFQKLPWWAIWPEGFGIDELRIATQQKAERFRTDLIQQTFESVGLETTEELIRILSACQSPADQTSVRFVTAAIGALKDLNRAFELASYWSTTPYFVSWDSQENIGKIYRSGSDAPMISLKQVNELYLEVSK